VAWPALSSSLSGCGALEGYRTDTSITLAGHSLGGVLAMLLAYDLAELGLNRAAPITVFSVGGPRVRNAAFKARCDELGVKALRVADVRDPIMRMPGVFLNEATTSVAGVLLHARRRRAAAR
jgi:pimeloyl-ACP methyl ester carboxylesterase